ncbi:MAG: ferredoxin [Bradyrhizobium sp.]|nr:ferredoxin [Bradyrhizobium sp.]
MPKLIVTDREGVEATFEATSGRSVMEILRDCGFGDIMAVCGGCCACSTCHVYVDPTADFLPPMTSDEDDLLDNLDGRRENSRLACQLKITAPFSALRLTVAPEE